MQFSKILMSAFAAVAVAAPATTPVEAVEKRSFGVNDAAFSQLGLINNGVFALDSFNYLGAINGFGVESLFFQNGLNQLAFQGLDLSIFGNLFNAQAFSLDVAFALNNLNFLLNMQAQGLFGNVALNNLAIPNLNLGLLGGINQFDLLSVLDASVFPQVQAIAQQSIAIIGKE